MSTFEERLAALEARTIGLADLPLLQLQRKLEQVWQPSALDLLGSAAIGPESMVQKLDYGTGLVVFTASTNSATATVSHDLGRTPVLVLAVALGAPAFGKIPLFNNLNNTPTTFDCNAELKVAHTGSIAFGWLAIA